MRTEREVGRFGGGREREELDDDRSCLVRRFPVSLTVNKIGNHSDDCAVPVSEQEKQQQQESKIKGWLSSCFSA